MVLTTASVLADFDARRTMVFCLWSSEEEGLWGSSAFAGDIPDGVTVSNYLNLDMAGINYPGDFALSVYLGPDGTGDVIDQPGMYHLAEWIGADAFDLSYQIERGRRGMGSWWRESFVAEQLPRHCGDLRKSNSAQRPRFIPTNWCGHVRVERGC